MTWVHSSELQFTRDGSTLAIAERDGVTLVQLRDQRRRQVALSDVQAIAAFAEQVWVATSTGVLHRLGADGRQVDEQPLPVDVDAILIPTMIGVSAALWSGREPVLLVDDLGRLATVPLQVGAAIPIAGRRFAHHVAAPGSSPRLTLPAGNSVTLAGALQIAGGSVILDGTALALVTEAPSGRGIVVLALACGRTLQTVSVPPGLVRIAARRGLAVVRETSRRLRAGGTRSTSGLCAVGPSEAGPQGGTAIDPGCPSSATREARIGSWSATLHA
jgi:hypothetical protein